MQLRAKEREQAALVAACQEHERREADMARQVRHFDTFINGLGI